MGRGRRTRAARNCGIDEIQSAARCGVGLRKKMRVLFAILFSMSLAGFAAAAAGPARPPIVGLSHVALYVHDIEKSRAFYKTLLGFDEPFSLTNQDGTLHLTWIKINDHQTIELFPE